MKGIKVLLAVLVAFLAAAAPASAQLPGSPGFDTVVGCDFLDPSVCLLPWPNDYFTKTDPSTDTGRRLDLRLTAMPRNRAGKPIDSADYNRNDGFSPGTPILVKVPGLDNDEAFARTGLVPETDMARAFDEDQPLVVLDADTGRRHLVWAELDHHAETTSDADRVLIVRPGRNFVEGHRYIVALRNLRDRGGDKLEAQQPFRVYRDGIPSADPAVEGRRAHFETRIFKPLADAGIGRKKLYLAWDFTVASERDRSERVLHMRDDAFAKLGDADLADLQVPANSAAPKFEVESVQENPNDNVARKITGTFEIPCYLDKPGCVPGSRMVFAPGQNVPTAIPGNTMTADFTCFIPKSVWNGAAGRPSLYGHGLLGSQSEVTAGNVRTMGQEHGFVFCATDWYGMATQDLGSVATILADLSNFPLLADRVQQGLLAQMFLGRLMVHPRGFAGHSAFQRGDGTATIDTTRLFYDGNSQGGIIGGALMALTPDAERGVLGVPGMNYSTLLQRSVDFETDPENPCPPTVDQAIEAVSGLEPEPDPEHVLEATGFSYACPLYASYPKVVERQLLFSLMQQLWDRAEGNGYAQHMTSDPYANTPPHEVLLHVALGDHQVAQVAAEVQARTIGALVRPQAVDLDRTYDVTPQFAIPRWDLVPFDGSVLEIWDSGPIRDGGQGTAVAPVGNVPPRAGRDPHSDPRATMNARRQKAEFLRVDGTATDFCSGLPCYSRGWKGAVG